MIKELAGLLRSADGNRSLTPILTTRECKKSTPMQNLSEAQIPLCPVYFYSLSKKIKEIKPLLFC